MAENTNPSNLGWDNFFAHGEVQRLDVDGDVIERFSLPSGACSDGGVPDAGQAEALRCRRKKL